ADYFTSPRAHNVVAVRGFSSRPSGASQVTDVRWVVRDGLVYFAGTHDGLAGPGIRHRRRGLWLPGCFWVVCDELLGTGSAELDSFIHLHPDALLQAACRGRTRLVAVRSAEAWAQLVFAGVRRVEVSGGIEKPEPHGWHAARHGERRAAPVVSLGVGGELPLLLGYAILPRTEAPAALSLSHDALHHLRATVRIDDGEYVVGMGEDDVELISRPA